MSTLEVLVVTTDRAQSEALEGRFRARFEGLGWTVVDSAARALSLLEQKPVDLLVSAADLADMSGYALFRAVRHTPAHCELAFVLLDETALETFQPSPYEVILERSAHPEVVLKRATGLLELPDAWSARRRRPRIKLRGSLEVVSLFDLVFTLAQKRTSGRLYLLLEGNEASLFLREGCPVHAAYGALTGEAAVTAIFAAAERRPDAEFYYEAGEVTPSSVTLHAPVQELLLKAAVALDRQRTAP